jgi:hypothetical protein
VECALKIIVLSSTLCGSSNNGKHFLALWRSSEILVPSSSHKKAMANARHQPYARYIDFDVAEKYVHIGGVRIEDDISSTLCGSSNNGKHFLALWRSSEILVPSSSHKNIIHWDD